MTQKRCFWQFEFFQTINLFAMPFDTPCAKRNKKVRVVNEIRDYARRQICRFVLVFHSGGSFHLEYIVAIHDSTMIYNITIRNSSSNSCNGNSCGSINM